MGYDVDYRVQPLTRLLSTTQKWLLATRDAFFRSGILFKESAPRRRRNRAKFFKQKKAERENADKCVIYQRLQSRIQCSSHCNVPR